MLSSASSEIASGDTFDVVIVCALPDPELRKVRDIKKNEKEWERLSTEEDPQRYWTTASISKAGNPIRIVAAAPNYKGMTSSAVLTTKMILRFRPKLVAMLGIAAGVKKLDRGFGDVLIAEQTIDYASGKIALIEGKRVFQPSPNPIPIDTGLLSHLKNRDNAADLSAISMDWQGNAPQTQLKVHFGPFGSADVVVDDHTYVGEALERWRQLTGIEMETYAVHRACSDTVQPAPLFIAIKSICDFASDKEDGWQNYAAYTASRFFFRFIFADWEELRFKSGHPLQVRRE